MKERVELCAQTYKSWWEQRGHHYQQELASKHGLVGLGERLAIDAFFAGWSSALASLEEQHGQTTK